MDMVKSMINNIFVKIKKNNEKITYIYLVINICWLFLGMVLYNYFRFSYRGFSISLIFLLIINVFFIFSFVHKNKFNKIDVFLILLTIFGIISTIFAKNISISLYGCWKRFEGLFQLLYYYSLMFLSTNILNLNYKKRIISFILLFGFINVLICFIQVFDIFKFIPMSHGVLNGRGLMLNTNFFGSYMILCLSLCIGIFLYCKKSTKNTLFNLFLCLFFYSGLLMSNAMSAMVGLFFVSIFIVFLYILRCVKNKNFKYNIFKHVILLFSCLIISFAFTISRKSLMFDDVVRFSNEASQMVSGNVSDTFGTSRIFIWKNTLKIVPRYLLHGVGIDNFYDAFDEPLFLQVSPTMISYYDKAHNEYLQKLVCEGIFSCISYITMLIVIFVNSFKRILKNDESVLIALFFAFIGYSVQAFFNISVIHIAPLFYMVCGLLYSRTYDVKVNN